MHGSQLRVAYQGSRGLFRGGRRQGLPGLRGHPLRPNSLGGSIHRNYDLLLRHRLHIVGEVQLPVHHCLLTLPGVRLEYLTRVLSHPQALAQCELTLTKMGLNVAREAVDDTAGRRSSWRRTGCGHGGDRVGRAAELYGLRVLADGIQDDASNVTRFVMLAREPIIPRTDRPFKTSIVFAHDREGTSVLFKVLSAFAFRDISLTKIESRPHRGAPSAWWTTPTSADPPSTSKRLAEIQEFTSFLRVLGSYPMDMTPWHAPRPAADDH
ncbi:unnamed protein product [Spirodela intermedia]|uniref:Arogenate dehydratase n=1 Tax=Spirodela intermedia TaxID=51605 RepID=A0A7I8J0F7_SPIIN|nr:unnamed protein product [Spirodela intermedia]CAA6663714.1 unnamed protein product [Spirodela intermedia]